MKRNSILICLSFAITANLFTTAKAQVNTTDSLALVDFYDSTNGTNWYQHTNWLTTKPVSTWFGITVANNSVTGIDLEDNNVSGTLPSSIGNLINLTTLSLIENYLNGGIPASIGNLINLTNLKLSEDRLTGAIPASIGNLTNLTDLNLSSNQLSDTIPASIGNCTNLKTLIFAGNQLSGAIPAEIGNLTNLNTLILTDNQLSGAIPAQIGNLINLTTLYSNYNQLTGTIPAFIGNLTNLTDLGFTGNQLTGAIPADIGNLTNLKTLLLGANQLTGAVPAALNKLTKLFYFDISSNQLSSFENTSTALTINSTIHGYLGSNLFTFQQAQFIATKYINITYAPQDTILPIHQNGNILSVAAGGTLSNNTYTWYKSGSRKGKIITGASTFHPTQSGNYYVHVTNSVATELTLYSNTVSYTMPSQTQNSIANVAAVKAFTNHFSVYPNPAKDVIHIQVNGADNIILTNSSGKILLSKTINNSGEIDLSGYANGIYYLQNKNTGETQKVVVIH